MKSVVAGRAIAALALLFAAAPVAADDAAPVAADLAGLWEARASYGPELRGRIVVDRTPSGWTADLMGRRIAGTPQGDSIVFDFGNNDGLRLDLKGKGLRGWWTQAQGPYDAYRFKTPVDFTQEAAGRWAGVVAPRDDVLTLFMPVLAGPDGKVSAWLRNPERNAGRFLNLSRVEIVDGQVRLIGKPFGARENQVVGRGLFDADNETLSIYVQRVGQTYEFHRVRPDQASAFWPRGFPAGAAGAVPYRYTAPPARADGWPVGTLAEAGISREGMERFIQTVIDLPQESNSASYLHAVLVARRGKLVLEEYFHGMDRDQIHDTRSAGKSVASVLFGAAMQGGYPVRPEMRVFETLGHPADDARKRAMTAEHLLLQTSGFHCDDDDSAAPGNEDGILDNRQITDWYGYSLDVPLITAPGSAAPVYCSMQPNLLGAVLARATGRPIEDLFRDLVANPMGIDRYALNIQPTGEPYHGGGLYLAPRDFMKFAQVMMDGGTWRGRRVVSADWARRSTSPLENFGNRQYGYLWWSQTYPYKGREVRAFYAAGNGGQIAMAIPELDLVICFMGGNYSDPALFIPQRKYVPEFILPAVD